MCKLVGTVKEIGRGVENGAQNTKTIQYHKFNQITNAFKDR